MLESYAGSAPLDNRPGVRVHPNSSHDTSAPLSMFVRIEFVYTL